MTGCGTVVERRADGQVVVRIERGAACDGCHARGACNMGFGARQLEVPAHDHVGAGVGQRVTIELADGAFLAACAWVYLVPLAGLLFAAGLAWGLLGWAGLDAAIRDAGSALAALGGLAGGAAVLWTVDRRVRDARGGPSGRFRAHVCALSTD
jgi:sigma-E factor negative regulatory protein RseC